eukprot:SAG11_NODE_19997_length_454_cov_2.901408_2_plen_28_part_01
MLWMGSATSRGIVRWGQIAQIVIIVGGI